MKNLLRLTTLGLFVSACSSVVPAAEQIEPDRLAAMMIVLDRLNTSESSTSMSLPATGRGVAVICDTEEVTNPGPRALAK